MPRITLDEFVHHEAAHALIAFHRSIPIGGIRLFRGVDDDDWGGGVIALGSVGFDRAVIALAGPAIDNERAAEVREDWHADYAKALDALVDAPTRSSKHNRPPINWLARIARRSTDWLNRFGTTR